MQFARKLAEARDQITDHRQRIHALSCSQHILIHLAESHRNPLPGGYVRACRRAAYLVRECQSHLEQAHLSQAISSAMFRDLHQSAENLRSLLEAELGGESGMDTR